mmetsp:Transcript_20894/g.51317  ORF Transcript_20894/g.51317 Transcript_20894/m.51317 type:complete len:142 (-) Transcript_20894:463-888(-)
MVSRREGGGGREGRKERMPKRENEMSKIFYVIDHSRRSTSTQIISKDYLSDHLKDVNNDTPKNIIIVCRQRTTPWNTSPNIAKEINTGYRHQGYHHHRVSPRNITVESYQKQTSQTNITKEYINIDHRHRRMLPRKNTAKI